MSETEKTITTPSIGISFQVPLADTRQIVLQSFVERDCSRQALDELLDKMRGAADRQNAIAQLAQAKSMLEQQEKQAVAHAAHMAQVEANIARNWRNGGRRGDITLTPKEIDEQRKAYANAQTLKDNIARIKTDIKKFEAIIGA